MKKHFYSHLIEIDSLVIKLHATNMTKEEKEHLLSLAESTVHHKIVDAILSELSAEDKKEFLSHVRDDSHEKIWDLLQNKVDGVEEKIKKAADEISRELHKDIEETTLK